MATPERLALRESGADEPVSVEVQSDGTLIVHPGSTFTATSFDGGFYLVADGSRTVRAYVAGPADRPWVFVDGESWEFEILPEGQGRAVGPPRGDGSLTAPMPATVVRLAVSAGDTVRQGDVLLMLEAMKMELPIRAPRDGRVTAIRCREGELVQPGAPLLDLA